MINRIGSTISRPFFSVNRQLKLLLGFILCFNVVPALASFAGSKVVEGKTDNVSVLPDALGRTLEKAIPVEISRGLFGSISAEVNDVRGNTFPCLPKSRDCEMKLPGVPHVMDGQTVSEADKYTFIIRRPHANPAAILIYDGDKQIGAVSLPKWKIE